MNPLTRKLLRDLARLRGQLATIALVVAAGVAAFVTLRSAYASLEDGRTQFYDDHRFADVYAHLQRAPETVARRIADIEGVSLVETRILTSASLPMEGMSEPASMTVVSLPERLNTLYLVAGRMPEDGQRHEIVVSDAFAEAHHLEPGAELEVVLGGVRMPLRVVGIGISPEHIILLKLGEMSMDSRRSGAIYMGREQLAASLDMAQAFNDVTLRLQNGANEDDVVDAVDEVLDRYGGLGAYGADRVLSNMMLDQELGQLENMATNIPPLFLLVAAFLLHVVLSRLVQLQRPQIATLKALGYSNAEIGRHFMSLALVIVVMGAFMGIGLGIWMTDAMIGLYTEYFRFPSLRTTLDLRTTAIAILTASAAAALGTLTAVRKVLVLSPAEAMRPAAPSRYGRGLFSRLPFIGPATRMVLREVERRPLRVMLSVLAISLAVGLMVVGRFMADAMDYLANDYMHQSLRWDVQVVFERPRPATSLRSFHHLPGVYEVEGGRTVPVEISKRNASRNISITAYPDDAQLQWVLDENGRRMPIPDDGLMLTSLLGEIIGVHEGDTVRVEVLEGERQTLELPVVAFVDELMGLGAHTSSRYLHRVLGEEASVSSALLSIDADHALELDERLTQVPDVLAISHMDRIMERFREQSANNIWVMSLIMALFAATIAVGVVYNNARVALSMRSRDLASLRVLGFTRAEIASILVGELALQVLIAIPIGLVLGRAMAAAMATGVDPEMYRLPVIVSTRTYAFAALLTLATAVFSAWLVRRKLYALDLIEVLKTRE